ncbi:MAG: glycosyltransferase, partial [Sarcina sp.]
MKESEILITSIVPVYNAERYLEECLNSIVNQTIEAHEIILINDGSTDRSLSILRSYEDKHENIKVIDKKNEGVAKARNIGREQAKGKYISFIDSDDVIDKHMYEVMVNLAEEKEADVIECNYERFNRTLNKNEEIKEVVSREILDSEILKKFLELEIDGYVWNKIYRRAMLNRYKINFDEIKCFEDMMFNLRVLIDSKKYIHITNKYYKYRYNDESLTANMNENKIKLYSIEMNKWCNFFENKNIRGKEKDSFILNNFINLNIWSNVIRTKKNRRILKEYLKQ